jgi:putative PIG3 family NAD(P)H quinone oxidoreductase
MRAVVLNGFGGPEVLEVADIPIPALGAEDVLVDVVAAGVNRADLSQREGHYPPPAGAPEWPGMEISGTVLEVGDSVTEWARGDRVCALVSGGGYAERAVVNRGLLLRVPDSVNLVDAAGIPEAVATVWANVVLSAGLRSGQTLLVHGGTSGIGTTAIQLGTALGCTVFATAGTAAKVEFCESLGAIGINYRENDFAEVVASQTGGAGANVILDIVGADYLPRNVASLAVEGSIMIIANQSLGEARFDIGALMRKRGRIWSAGLRARPLDERAAIIAAVQRDVMPWFADGTVRPIIDTVFALEEAADAHRRMATSEHTGKILLSTK